MLLKIFNKLIHGKRMKECVQIYTNNVFWWMENEEVE